MTSTLEPISIDAIRSARSNIDPWAIRTPLVRLNADDASADIYLKLENLQPIGSFKIRGAANAMALADPESLAEGVYTASAGNMAQGVGWLAKQLGIAFSVVVPDHAPETKLAAIERLGGTIVKVPFEQWWKVITTHHYPGLEGLFIHPVSDPAVIAGNGTIGLEILEDLPDVDTIVVPYGGGGLSSGIASAVRATRPDVRVLAVEVETAAPLTAALAAGEPTEVEYTASWVDGMGSGRVLDDMWPLVSSVLAGSLVISLDEAAAAVRHLLARNRVLAEGAGAASVAAAMNGSAGSGKVACIVSGGNIDLTKLVSILDSDSQRS